MKTKKTQKKLIVKALLDGHVLTWLSGFKLCGTSKLSTRIGELEHDLFFYDNAWYYPFAENLIRVFVWKNKSHIMSYRLKQKISKKDREFFEKYIDKA